MARNLTTGLQRGLRQSIAGGLGAGDIFSTASLDLNFARHKRLDPRVTHTRASNATYVDGDGIIKDAVTNLLLRSEDFTTGWAASSGSTVDADDATSPDGTTNADKYSVGTSTFPQVTQSSTTTVSAVHTLTVYAKAAGKNFVQVRLRNAGATGNYFRAIFNLTDGSITQATAFGNGVYTSSNATDVGNGWWRLSVTGTADTSGTSATTLFILTHDADGTIATPSNSEATDGVLLWGAQLEQSSTAGEYVKTTSTINSAPRFDHNPTTGESLGLLVEESRTNLMPYSVATTTDWSSSGGTLTDLSLNALGVFPGVRCASGGLVYHGLNTGQITGLTNGATYTVTFWFRAGDTDPSNMVRFIVRNDTTAAPSTIQKNSRLTAFDSINSYTASDAPVGTSTSNLAVLSAETMADGLTYKLVASFVCEGSSTDSYKFGIHTNSATVGETVIALGMQLEQGSFATSYIPTTGSTATRSADVASITGTNFSSWYNQTEGTVFADTEKPSLANTVVTSISDGTSSNRIELRSSAGGVAQVRFEIVESGSAGYSRTFNVDAAYKKLAFAYAENNSHGVANGVLDTTDTSVAIPTVDNLYFGNNLFLTNQRPGHIKRLTYWPTRLSNDTLQTITR